MSYNNSFIEKMRYYASRFNASNDDIHSVYKKPSDFKVDVYEYLRDIAIDNDCRVLSHNCHQFTTGMYTTSPETGEVLFRVDTRDNVYLIPARYINS